MIDLCVIIPLHMYNEEVDGLLKTAIASVPVDYEVRISCPFGMAKELENMVCTNNVVVMEGKEGDGNSFCSLVNQAVGGTKYFSILEYDDTYTDIWFKNVEKYIEYKPEVSCFMPLTDLVDFETKKYIGYGNEAPWASSFSNEIGYVDHDCLEGFFDFYMTGSIFNTEDFEYVGKLKSSYKLTFWYEYLLRATNEGKTFFVIPKIGYKHVVNRPNSLFDIYKNTLSEDETSYWFELAKKDYFFKVDSNKTYDAVKNNEEGN